MDEELRAQLRKRVEVARRLRFENPKLSVEILCDIVSEMLRGRDQKPYPEAVTKFAVRNAPQ
jgi:hypothetical protein